MGYWWDICMNIIFFKRHHPIPSSPHWKESTGETHVAMAERPRGVQNGSCVGPKPNQANGMMSTIINGLVQGKIYKKRWCLSHNTGVSCRFWSKPIWDINLWSKCSSIWVIFLRKRSWNAPPVSIGCPEMVDLPAMHGNFNGESNDKSDKPWHLGPLFEDKPIFIECISSYLNCMFGLYCRAAWCKVMGFKPSPKGSHTALIESSIFIHGPCPLSPKCVRWIPTSPLVEIPIVKSAPSLDESHRPNQKMAVSSTPKSFPEDNWSQLQVRNVPTKLCFGPASLPISKMPALKWQQHSSKPNNYSCFLELGAVQVAWACDFHAWVPHCWSCLLQRHFVASLHQRKTPYEWETPTATMLSSLSIVGKLTNTT